VGNAQYSWDSFDVRETLAFLFSGISIGARGTPRSPNGLGA